MSKFVFLESSPLVQALYDAGVIAEDFESIRRIVIDLEVGNAARVYVDRFADDEKLTAGIQAGLRVVSSEEESGRVGVGSPVRPEDPTA